jgi:hypothetical protein
VAYLVKKFIILPGSVSCLLEPATEPYPEPDESSTPTSLRCILILSSHLSVGLTSDIFP